MICSPYLALPVLSLRERATRLRFDALKATVAGDMPEARRLLDMADRLTRTRP